MLNYKNDLRIMFWIRGQTTKMISNDDDDNDDDDDFVVWLTDEGRLALFPAGTIVRDPQHRESPTRRE